MTRPFSLLVCAALALSPRAARADDDELATLRTALEAQQAQIDALQADSLARAERDDKDSPFRIYGFIDVGIQKMFLNAASMTTTIFPSDSTTFVLGNVNLYFDAQPIDHWRALFEVRLTSAPDGNDTVGDPLAPYRRTSTKSYDSTSASGGWSVIRWGAIVLERAYIEWRHSDYLSVRVGTFLTPAGIWNVDHGSPTLIALMMPQFLVFEMFPPRQTGLQVFGTHHFAPWALDYVAYVSNGRVASQLDPTEDKAFGGRLVLRHSGKRRFALGTSFYTNRFSDQRRDVVQTDPFTVERTETVAFNEQTVGVDASFDLGPVRLRSEMALRHVVYDDGKRAGVYDLPNVREADHNELDAYLLGAYQLPWLGLEPFVNFELLQASTTLGDQALILSAGFNVHFTPATTLKVQGSRSTFLGDWATSSNNVHFLAARVVLAF